MLIWPIFWQNDKGDGFEIIDDHFLSTDKPPKLQAISVLFLFIWHIKLQNTRYNIQIYIIHSDVIWMKNRFGWLFKSYIIQ